jgi:predicted transcriptional regulator of viral defense system
METTYAGIPASEVIAFTEAINYLDLVESRLFGDAVNAAIVRNVKAAGLKGQAVSIRGLSRVIGMQPSTIRRRIANLVEHGWLIHDDRGLRYSPAALERGAPEVRKALLRFASTLKRLGWGDFRPPP